MTQAAPQTETTAPQDRPFKTLDMKIQRAEFRHTASGTSLINLVGVDDKGRRSRAIVWAEEGQRIANFFQDKQPSEESPFSAKLTGYWKPRNWTNQRGENVKSFEFVVKEHDIPVAAATAEATRPETAPNQAPDAGKPANQNTKNRYDLDDDLPF